MKALEKTNINNDKKEEGETKQEEKKNENDGKEGQGSKDGGDEKMNEG